MRLQRRTAPSDTSPRHGLDQLALVFGAGGAVVYLAFRAGGVTVGVLSCTAVLFAGALRLQVKAGSDEAAFLQRLFTAGVLALPGGLVAYFAFTAGGYFPDAPAFGALVLLALVALRAMLVDDPFAGFSRPLAVAAGALALYTAWTLLSALWSDAFSRALIEADRALLYLLALVLLGSVPRSPERLRWVLRGVALAMVAVAVCALATRVLPEVFPTAPSLANQRLSYPMTYWNGLGMLGSLAAILCLHLTASLREPAPIRVLAAAALPLVCTMVYFTFSRGAIAAGIVGLALYAVLAWPRGLATALLAAVPLTVLGVSSAYGADLLATPRPTTAGAIEQGHDVAGVLALCALGAAVLRALLLPLDKRLLAVRLTPRVRRPLLGSSVALGIVSAAALALAFHVPERVHDQYRLFVHTNYVNEPSGDFRGRLTDPGNGGRIEHWRVGVRGFHRAESHGLGAGTFGLQWYRDRPPSQAGSTVHDAHSLYVENLSELGLVGLGLLVVTLLVVLASLLPIRRGDDRALYVALFAGTLAWAIHAGVDWDWELPALTVWLFAFGGLALAANEGRARSFLPGRGLRLAIALMAALLAIGPGLVLQSENRLDRSARAFNRGDCGAAIHQATSSTSVLSSRPEPYEILGYCQARRGAHRRAVRSLQRAVDRDPENWEFHYGLALVRGAGGMDPRGAARAALRLNPHAPVTRALVARLRRRPEWRRTTVRLIRDVGLSVVR